ncbi:class F sortase [Arthrobacter jiangjiafuii]|uniref:Class F sortase n=1 Tax=Arthrobacter jiangjiafuii TaxID=2817475 RepID=A0A975M308_9MICC|nr:class F sortase [Arthrobacter jiangjiafuii]MBP3043515.1 class F sortase [Arthrobacter jiangjiafuii]QWC09031.1 class F sortase [Arthrobacter jiangjiafuii]
MTGSRSRRFRAGAALVAALAIGATACGDAQEAAAPPAAVQTPAQTPAQTPEPALERDPAAGASAASPTIPVRPATPETPVSIPLPVRVQVEGTGIDLEVIPVGVEDNGAMTLPGNHYQAGWYRYGPAPGAGEGSTVLAAHVDSRTEQLPIAGLKDVDTGTIITVTREDGSILRYTAERVENIAKTSLDGHRLFDRTGEPRLKLVTCGGKWLEARDDYEDNVVLTAAPVS